MRRRVFSALLVTFLFEVGCHQPSAPTKYTSYAGHTLGEDSMIWAVEENVGQSDPLQQCQELLRSPSVNSSSKAYTDCEDFVFKGNYTVKVTDWQSHQDRSFRFSSWKLSVMAFDYQLEDRVAVTRSLTKTFGPPVSENHWNGPDHACVSLLQNESEKKVMVLIGFHLGC